MKPFRFLLVLCSLFVFTFCNAQQASPEGNPTDDPDLLFFVNKETIIGSLSDGKIYTGPDDIAYTLKGNIIYTGDSAIKDSILLLVGSDDLLRKKPSYIYDTNGKDIVYSIRRGQVYLGERSAYSDLEMLMTFKLRKDGNYDLFDGIENKYLGTIVQTDGVQPVELAIALHLYVMHYDLDIKVNELISQEMGENGQMRTGTGSGVIKPKWSDNAYYEWIWDGHFLRPAWGSRAEDEWKFDGKYIKPVWGYAAQEEWTWDGRILKKFWANGTQDQWIWEGDMLRPFWDSQRGAEWRFDGQTVEPYWYKDVSREWIVEGDVPLPIIAMVVLGIADR